MIVGLILGVCIMNEEMIVVEISALAFGGDGVGRLEDGAVVFVPYTAPGDKAMVRIVARKKNFCKGELVQLMNDNPIRVAPRCKYFGRCGGCQYQHIDWLHKEHIDNNRYYLFYLF